MVKRIDRREAAPHQREDFMKRRFYLFLTGLMILFVLSGCSKKSTLDPQKPVTLTLWHVYGEQADSPMNRLVEEFNQTAGQEKGIIINVTLMANASSIGTKLLDAQKGTPGVPAMPDLFFCHNSNVKELGAENLINWKDLFTDEELDGYIPEFLEDGMVDGRLSIFPVSKSTHLLYLAGAQFDRFSADTGVTADSLSTWDGFFDTAEKYYQWSGGKPFCAIDYLIRCVELNAMEKGASDFYSDDGWYDFDNEIFKASYLEFAKAIAKGYIVVSDLYSNTQVMTNEVAAGLGSSASILYYNDTITYPDNTSEPMDLRVLPMPKAAGTDLLITQAGVGLCALKTTEQKMEAAAVFARWLTESRRNLDFCVETGYMPVNRAAFDQIPDYPFTSEAYKNLYATLNEVNQTGTAMKEPSFPGYYAKVYQLYDKIRSEQTDLPTRYQTGTDVGILADEMWDLFRSIQ